MLRILGSPSAQHYLDLDGVPVRADAAVVLSLAPNTHTMLRVALPGRGKHLTESFPCLRVGEFACLVCLLHALELDAVEDERAELETVGACGRSHVQLTRRFETAGASHSEWKQARRGLVRPKASKGDFERLGKGIWRSPWFRTRRCRLIAARRSPYPPWRRRHHLLPPLLLLPLRH